MTKEELKQYFKPITDGLFGPQRNVSRYERPKFAVRTLERMMRDLADIPDEDWHNYAFSTEPLEGKFTDETRAAYGEKSRACGKDYAQRMIKQYGTNDPVQLARALKMNVSYPEYPEKTDRVTFAEFREPRDICIYMDAVKRAKRSLQEDGALDVLTTNLDVSRLLLAHELFHFVEESHKKDIYTRTEKIQLWKVGPVRNTSVVIAFSEIAAMAFAKELIGLPYSPYLMDVFLVYGYSPQEASGVYETMMQYAGREPYLPPEDGEAAIADSEKPQIEEKTKPDADAPKAAEREETAENSD